MIRAVVGLNWGDEGKGKMTDYFAENADCVIRYQGGDNAGHTVINKYGKFAFHNVPSGICHDDTINIIGPGSVINLESFYQEISELREQGIKIDESKIIISDRANIIFPFHRLLDKLEDERLKDKKYGSTMSGIAPVYGDKYMKKGIQVGELFYPEYLKRRIKDLVEYTNLRLEGIYKNPNKMIRGSIEQFDNECLNKNAARTAKGSPAKIDYSEVMDWLIKYGQKIKPYIKNIQPCISKLINEEKDILLEAQLGALRDITHGIYPYTTSSSTLAGYSCASVPIPPRKIEQIIGITKAYSTCVGSGAFVTEINGKKGDIIREKGGEYGAKTGRPRRVGHFDAVATKYGVMLQSADTIVLTCLDILSGFEELKICTHYNINGNITDQFSIYPELLKADPVYEKLPGWNKDISGITNYRELPDNAKKYIKRIEELCEVPIKYISTGPERESIINLYG
ncbi:MAG: adenylosuccinate synthase [Halanaerobiales bacterium]